MWSTQSIVIVLDESSNTPPLEAATLYTYKIGVIYETQETLGGDRLQLEGEYWPGNYNDPISSDYATDPNREGRWRPFETLHTLSDFKYRPTFENKNNDASSQHNIFHFYYREKAACTCEFCLIVKNVVASKNVSLLHIQYSSVVWFRWLTEKTRLFIFRS